MEVLQPHEAFPADAKPECSWYLPHRSFAIDPALFAPLLDFLYDSLCHSRWIITTFRTANLGYVSLISL